MSNRVDVISTRPISASQMLMCDRQRSSGTEFDTRSESLVIINADDFGLSAEIDSAIMRFAESRAISSVSLMAVGADFDQAASWAAVNQHSISIGVHLCLSDNLRPLTPMRELLENRGKNTLATALQTLPCSPRRDENAPHFRRRTARFGSLTGLAIRSLCGALPLGAIREEWGAQIDRVRSRGIQPTHLDSHQHVHILPSIASLVAELAAEHKLAVRHTNGPFGFSFSRCSNCLHYWTTCCRPGVLKSMVLRRLGVIAKRHLISSGVPTTYSYISPSSLCGRMRRGASPEAVNALVCLSANSRGVVEWVVHPSDALSESSESGWMAHMRACDNDMLESCAHLELLKRAGIRIGSYADVGATRCGPALSGEQAG